MFYRFFTTPLPPLSPWVWQNWPGHKLTCPTHVIKEHATGCCPPHPRKINYLRPRGPTSKRSFRRSFNFAVPVRSSARNASCGRGEGEKGERRRNEITGQWTKYLRPPHCPLGPPLFPTRGLRSVTGQRGGNYPATVLYLLRRRRDCVPPRHVCSPLPPPLLLSPARHRSVRERYAIPHNPCGCWNYASLSDKKF